MQKRVIELEAQLVEQKRAWDETQALVSSEKLKLNSLLISVSKD